MSVELTSAKSRQATSPSRRVSAAMTPRWTATNSVSMPGRRESTS
jgi:hypothetical protein